MAQRLIQISVVYFVIGVVIGLYMSIKSNYELTPVHVHIILLGWMSLALAGIIYKLYPKLAENKLAKIHFWLHNLSLPVMMIGLACLIKGAGGAVPFISISATVLVIAIILYGYNVFMNINKSPT